MPFLLATFMAATVLWPISRRSSWATVTAMFAIASPIGVDRSRSRSSAVTAYTSLKWTRNGQARCDFGPRHHAPGARKARRSAISPGHPTFSPSSCLASVSQIAGPLTVQEMASGPVRCYGQGEDCDQEVPAVTISTKPPVIGGVNAGEMQPRTRNRRHGLIATLPLALLLAACGGGTSPSSHHDPGPDPQPDRSSHPPPRAYLGRTRTRSGTNGGKHPRG